MNEMQNETNEVRKVKMKAERSKVQSSVESSKLPALRHQLLLLILDISTFSGLEEGKQQNKRIRFWKPAS